MALAPVKDMDHLVLTCGNVATTISWYTTHLGMTAQTFTSGSGSDRSAPRHALLFGTHKINLHQRGSEFEPKARTALPGTADLCFLLDDGVDMEGLREGLVRRAGARGELRSLYVRDPDGNLIE